MGAIAELTDAGLPIHFHVGNHDMWTFGYLEEELGVHVHREPIVRTWDGLTCLVGHGDGLGPGDAGYRRLKRVFTSPVCQALFRRLHPDLGMALAHAWSAKSRSKGEAPMTRLDQEHLHTFAKGWLDNQTSRRSTPSFLAASPSINVTVEGHSATYLNTGDWLTHFTSANLYRWPSFFGGPPPPLTLDLHPTIRHKKRDPFFSCCR